jgi:hypothetical protein
MMSAIIAPIIIEAIPILPAVACPLTTPITAPSNSQVKERLKTQCPSDRSARKSRIGFSGPGLVIPQGV